MFGIFSSCYVRIILEIHIRVKCLVFSPVVMFELYWKFIILSLRYPLDISHEGKGKVLI
jgi:hypothetical protein